MNAQIGNLQTFSSQGFYLNGDQFKGPVGYALRGRLHSLQQQISCGCLRFFLMAQHLVRCQSKCLGNTNKRRKVGFTISTHVMGISALTQTTPSRCLGIRNPQLLRPISQIFTKHIHENVLFWIVRSCHELIGAISKTILFTRSAG